mmetsp:Transcript_18803/g.52417  ORF Transcript_18803/g.52417 Transcript_18803/m.52417 type:complete len:413 (+) Transcript_18803:252-1490(+)
MRSYNSIPFLIPCLLLFNEVLKWDYVAAEPLSTVKLSRFGNRVRTVVFASLTDSGVCSLSKHGSMDWRSTLPKYIAGHLNASVVVWDAVSAATDAAFADTCVACRPGEEAADQLADMASFSCKQWLKGQGRSSVDLVVVVGTHASSCKSCPPDIRGDHYGILKWAVNQSWIGDRTKLLHIPISTATPVLHNQVVRFDKVIPDSALIKPVHSDDFHEMQEQMCSSDGPRNSLLYIGRFMERKGQESFLQAVQPEQLRGYTIEFFSSKHSPSIEENLLKISRDRGLDVIVHREPATRAELFHAMLCRARGVIHYAKDDMNPRILYESLTANLPVLITRQSRIPETISQQPFVAVVDFGQQQSLDTGLYWFMRLVSSSNNIILKETIQKFSMRELREDLALHSNCVTLGLCASRR